MVWKQDLAKLKQQLGESPKAPPPKPAPKPVEKPAAPADLATEDALFLTAMGKRPAPPPAPREPEPAVPPAPQPPPAPESFAEALADLKGLKPLVKPRVLRSPTPAPGTPPPASEPVAPPPQPAVAHPDPGPTTEPASTPAPSPEVPASGTPLRFQLAAGMALEVDGVLDLRGHRRSDAVERLKDRLADGLVLGWRSIQVILGPDPDLHEGLLNLLESGQAPMISRYAQAPVPMGGTQAWLLYFGPQA